MSLMNRIQAIVGGGLSKLMGPSEGTVGQLGIATAANTAAFTLTTAQLALGVLRITSISADRAVTVPLATAITAAAPDMGVGDSFHFWASNTSSFIATWTANTGVTLAGRATLPAGGFQLIVVTKTGTDAYTWTAV